MSSTSRIDRDALAKAEFLLREAMGVLMSAVEPTGVGLRTKAEVAVRELTGLIADQAELFDLHPNLVVALSEVGSGAEPYLPEDIVDDIVAVRDFVPASDISN